MKDIDSYHGDEPEMDAEYEAAKEAYREEHADDATYE